ncbi:MAG: hypothetical protein N2111_12720 [Candidatus Sumerlaeaceae bacterium]|nr:hypothetical protein [Candidatus Sumerlaeaceae bacterium]
MDAAGPDKRATGFREWVWAAWGAAAAVVLWLPALNSPLWQEDYVWIAQARAGVAWPGIGDQLLSGGGLFWRPLGVGAYWRAAMALTGGSPPLLHALGLLLHLMAFMAVGVFGARLAAALATKPHNTPVPAAAAAFFFGTHTAHFLPTHWASGRQQTLLVLFEALALTGWLGLIVKTDRSVRSRWASLGLLTACIAGTAGALGSTEAAVMLPVLGAVLWYALPHDRRLARLRDSVAAMGAAAAATAMTVAWLAVRSQLVVAPAADSPYAPAFGFNIPRNLLTLTAFLAGVPREGLRMLWEGERVAAGAAWIFACGLLQTAAIAALARAGWRHRPLVAEPRRAALGLAAFALAALAPYLPLARHCYAYYALPALLTLSAWAALVAGRAPCRAMIPSALLGAAAVAAIMTLEHTAPYPSTLATARHAATMRGNLREQFRRLPQPMQRVTIDCPDDRLWVFMGWEPGIGDALDVDWHRVSRVKSQRDAPGLRPPPDSLRVRPPDP